MAALGSWLLGIIAAAMVLSILYGLLPKGTIRSISRVTGGLILMLVILRPLAGGDWTHLMTRYADYQESIDDRIENYRRQNEKETERIIREKTAAYISDKAVQMGLTCHAQVETRLQQGVPYPAAVSLDIPKNAELSDMIAEELGIPAEKQRWREG